MFRPNRRICIFDSLSCQCEVEFAHVQAVLLCDIATHRPSKFLTAIKQHSASNKLNPTEEQKTISKQMTADLEMKGPTDAIASDLDGLISDIGEFGGKQILHFILLCLPVTLSSTLLLNFFFTSATLDYRWGPT